MAAKKKTVKRRPSRPRIQFDLEEVDKLGALQCTDPEIAAWFKCSRDTIADRKANDPEFADALARGKERGKVRGKVSLRRAMWQAALGGNVRMMQWLSKQHLGMRENLEMSGPGGGPIEHADSAKAKLLELIAQRRS